MNQEAIDYDKVLRQFTNISKYHLQRLEEEKGKYIAEKLVSNIWDDNYSEKNGNYAVNQVCEPYIYNIKLEFERLTSGKFKKTNEQLQNLIDDCKTGKDVYMFLDKRIEEIEQCLKDEIKETKEKGTTNNEYSASSTSFGGKNNPVEMQYLKKELMQARNGFCYYIISRCIFSNNLAEEKKDLDIDGIVSKFQSETEQFLSSFNNASPGRYREAIKQTREMQDKIKDTAIKQVEDGLSKKDIKKEVEPDDIKRILTNSQARFETLGQVLDYKDIVSSCIEKHQNDKRVAFGVGRIPGFIAKEILKDQSHILEDLSSAISERLKNSNKNQTELQEMMNCLNSAKEKFEQFINSKEFGDQVHLDQIKELQQTLKILQEKYKAIESSKTPKTEESENVEENTINEAGVQEVDSSIIETQVEETQVEEIVEESTINETDVQEVDSPVIETQVEETEVEVETVADNSVVNENISNERETAETNVNEQDSDVLRKYALFMQDYYSKGKANTGVAHTKEEMNLRRRLNYKMKQYLELQAKKEVAKNFDTTSEKEFIEKLKHPIDSKDFNELFENKNAQTQLLKIMASGVYEDGGKRIRLTQKQRLALSNVLVAISEKQINQVSSKERVNKDVQMGY